MGALTALVLLMNLPTATALEIREGFEWDWSPTCTEHQTQWSSCFEIAGCANERALFVRRTNAGVCEYSSAVRFWTGARYSNSPPHAPARPTVPRELEGQANEWTAAHFRDPRFAAPNGDTFEILSTRDEQRSRFGRMQVDFHVPRDVPISGSGEHYLVMHNLTLTGVTPCPGDGAGCPENARTSYGGIRDHPGSYKWYGVIAGAFGSGSPSIPHGSVGFAVEVSAEGAGGNHLIEGTFLPYSVGGKQAAFPRGTYRVSIERSERQGVDTYAYTVERWNITHAAWEPISPDGHDGGKDHNRSNRAAVPFARLVAPIGFELPLGYIGLSAAWFGSAASAADGASEITWDNLVVDW